MFSNQEEDEILHIDELSNALKGTSGSGLLPQRPEEILQSTTDAEEWHLEVERVAPQLKVTVRVDARDWRTHLEQVLDLFTIQFLMRLFVFHLVHHLTIKYICLFFFCIEYLIEIEIHFLLFGYSSVLNSTTFILTNDLLHLLR
jgi:hypothetical protein